MGGWSHRRASQPPNQVRFAADSVLTRLTGNTEKVSNIACNGAFFQSLAPHAVGSIRDSKVETMSLANALRKPLPIETRRRYVPCVCYARRGSQRSERYRMHF